MNPQPLACDPGIAPAVLAHAIVAGDELRAVAAALTSAPAALGLGHLRGAIAANMAALTRTLLERSPVCPFSRDGHGESLLSVAATHGSAAALQELVTKHPGPDHGWRRLFLAHDNDATQFAHVPPLMRALQRGNRDVALLLIGIGANIHEALRPCVVNNDPRAAELAWALATEHGGVEPARADAAMRLAAIWGHHAVVRTLLRLGADPDTASLPAEESALARAGAIADPRAFCLLLEAGARVERLLSGGKPAHAAAQAALRGFNAARAAKAALAVTDDLARPLAA